MTKLRDPTSPAGAFRDSIYHLPADPEHGDSGIERAIRETGKKERTLYGYHDPEGLGPPVAIAEIVDEIHRRNGGIEHNLAAWQERRENRTAGEDGSVGPEPTRLIERIVSDMEQATAAVLAGHGNVQDLLRRKRRMIDAYAALSGAIFDRIDRESLARNRRADDRPPTRPTVMTRPTLVRGG